MLAAGRLQDACSLLAKLLEPIALFLQRLEKSDEGVVPADQILAPVAVHKMKRHDPLPFIQPNGPLSPFLLHGKAPHFSSLRAARAKKLFI